MSPYRLWRRRRKPTSGIRLERRRASRPTVYAEHFFALVTRLVRVDERLRFRLVDVFELKCA